MNELFGIFKSRITACLDLRQPGRAERKETGEPSLLLGLFDLNVIPHPPKEDVLIHQRLYSPSIVFQKYTEINQQKKELLTKQTALLEITYEGLDKYCADNELWTNIDLLNGWSPIERKDFVLQTFGRESAIKTSGCVGRDLGGRITRTHVESPQVCKILLDVNRNQNSEKYI